MCLTHKNNESEWVSISVLAMFYFLSFSVAQSGLKHRWSYISHNLKYGQDRLNIR